MNEKNYIQPYCKVAGKILSNVLGIGIIAALVTYFAFKSYFDIVTAFCTVILIITVIMLVVSFIAAIIFDVNASEKLKGWQKSLRSGILAMIDMVAARAMCLIFTNLSWNATPDAKMFNQVINGAFAALIAATLIDLVTCGKRSLRDEIKDTDLSYDRINMKAGIFYLTELQVFIVAIFAAALFFPATYFIRFAVSPLYYAIALVIAVFVVLAVIALIKAVCVRVQYKYQKSRVLLYEEIMDLLDQRLFLTKEDIEELCKVTYPKYTARYPRLIDQILSDEIDKGNLKQTTVNNIIVYTTRDPKKLTKEYFKKISILNKNDLLVLGIGTSLTLLKSMGNALLAKMMGFNKGIDQTKPNKRLKHNAKKITDEERKKLKNFAGNHPKMSERTAKIICTMSVPYDAISGSKAIGKVLSGRNHRLETLGHDNVLGWLFGVVNILTDTITFRDFRTYRVDSGTILPVEITFAEALLEAISIVRETPDCFAAALCKQAIHIHSDMFTKMGLPIPTLEVLFDKISQWMYVEKHYDSLCGLRDLTATTVSAVLSVIINIIIKMIHKMFYDPKKDNKVLYNIRTDIIIAIADNIASSSSVIISIVTKNPQYLDMGAVIVSFGQTVVTTNSVVGTYMQLKYDLTNKPRIMQMFIQYNQIKQESSLQQT